MFERLVALDVTDEEGYARYRAAMMPILERYGGAFRHDFRISETLKSEVSHPVNRLFVLAFPDEATMGRFFQDPRYRAVRGEHFDPSVAASTVLSVHQVQGHP